jgi:hypothetical protein
MIPLPTSVDLDSVVANSYRDFHCKGLDYLCLKRSKDLTLKLYFFDGDVSKLPSVVFPHDHRYDFNTWVVAGSMQNLLYAEGGDRDYQLFDYSTPLNGGTGFTWVKPVRLKETEREVFYADGYYPMKFNQIHTIRMLSNETVLFLAQFESCHGVMPTHTYSIGDVAPSFDGLYNRFTPDGVVALLKRFTERTGYNFGAL